MSKPLNRREFLKVVAAGAGASLALGACGELAPKSALISLPQGGQRTAITTCGECPRVCALRVQTAGGQILSLVHHPPYASDDPTETWATCAMAQLAAHKLTSPRRYAHPLHQARGAQGAARKINWSKAIRQAAAAFHAYRPEQIAFVVGLFPDHLNDLAQMLSQGLGGANVLRFAPQSEYEGRITLLDAAQRSFGAAKIPFFDLQHTDLVFSFGSSLAESWLNQRAATRQIAWRAGAYSVHFEAGYSQAPDWADEYYPIKPGSYAALAQALAAQMAIWQGDGSARLAEGFDLPRAAEAAGLTVEQIQRLARLFYQAERKLAIPGSAALSSANGPITAAAILGLNSQAANLGRPGGLFLPPESPLYPWLTSRPSSAAEIQALVERIASGQVKALFVHGVDLVAALPDAFGLRQALPRLEQLFSFASLPDETSRLADYILPDHLALESWGYQRILPGAERTTVQAVQPVVQPAFDTRASADVLLAAFHLAGKAESTLPFTDELDFLRHSLFRLAGPGGRYRAAEATHFWRLWQQQGGWQAAQACLIPPVALHSVGWPGSALLNSAYPFYLTFIPRAAPDLSGFKNLTGLQEGPGSALLNNSQASAYPFHLAFIPMAAPDLSGFKNLTGLQEGPGSALSNSAQASAYPFHLAFIPMAAPDLSGLQLVEIHPGTAAALGLRPDTRVRLISPAGQIRATLRLNARLAPDTLALPWSPNNPVTDIPRNPLNLLGAQQNSAGNLIFADQRVNLEAI